jgi:amidase
MAQVGGVMLPEAPAFLPTRLLIAEDAFAYVGVEITDALAGAVTRLKAALSDHCQVKVYTSDPSAWSAVFRILQGDEIRLRHSAWIDAHNPNFGPGIVERFRWTRTIDPTEVERIRPRREDVAWHMQTLLGLPTAPGIAPKLATPTVELEAFRARAFALLSVAGLARLPQLSLPFGMMADCPLGISLIAPRGRDRGLVKWVAEALA